MKKIDNKKLCAVIFFFALSMLSKDFFNKQVYAESNQEPTKIQNNDNSLFKLNSKLRTHHELGLIPIIQKVSVGGAITQNVTSLFQNTSGIKVKLKDEVVIDSSKIGFQWVAVTLVDESLNEFTRSVPVNVYNPKTTTFDDSANIAINVEENEIPASELQESKSKGTTDQLIIEKMNITSWSMNDGSQTPIELDTSNLNLSNSSQHVIIKSRNQKNRTSSIQKILQLKIATVQENGWIAGFSTDKIERNGFEIGWKDGLWWYTYNGNKWLYSNSIEAALIINGNFYPGSSDRNGLGFLRENSTTSSYAINKETNSLKRTFTYQNKFKIDIIQKLLQNNAVEVTYQVTNLGSQTVKIGLSQFADVFVGADTVPVTPINNFKGINLTFDQSSLVIIPDPKTLPNWAAGYYTTVSMFGQYNIQSADGIGWETGSRFRGNFGLLLTPPQILKENIPILVGDSGVAVKNPGVNVEPSGSTTFKQTLKFGKLSKPEVTIEQNKGYLYQDEEINIAGTIVVAENQNYRLYLELDDEQKTLIPLKEYVNIPYGQKQIFNVKVKGELFKAGVHDVSILGIDEYGTRSAPQKLSLSINELSALPAIQKVKIGEQLTDDLAVLVENLKGTNIVLKNKSQLDSSKVGFSWVEVTLEANKEKEIQLKIPVNVFDPSSTIYDEKNNIMLDVKDSHFTPVDIKVAEEMGKLKDLIVQKTQPKSWNMDTGLENEVVLTSNNMISEVGIYKSLFVAQNKETQATIQKETKLIVDGELKFKSVPDTLLFSPTKLSQKENYVQREDSTWEIDIENTVGSNWSLFISGSPLTNQIGESMKNSLIFKDSDAKDQPINENLQKIVIGEKKVSYPKVQWKANEGPLIKMNQGLKIGEYTGELYWTLSDAP